MVRVEMVKVRNDVDVTAVSWAEKVRTVVLAPRYLWRWP